MVMGYYDTTDGNVMPAPRSGIELPFGARIRAFFDADLQSSIPGGTADDDRCASIGFEMASGFAGMWESDAPRSVDPRRADDGRIVARRLRTSTNGVSEC
jgi:hypothetical protein